MYASINIDTPTPMEDDDVSSDNSIGIDIDVTEIDHREFTTILDTSAPYITPPRNPSFSEVSPPKLVRNLPGSNIWRQREDGTIVNQTGYVFPVPLRLFSTDNDTDVNATRETIDTTMIRSLEEGIMQGRVAVRDETVNMMALEEGIARGHIATRRGTTYP